MTAVTLPCRADPTRWDITGGDKPKGCTSQVDVHRALAAVTICEQVCPVFESLPTARHRPAAHPPLRTGRADLRTGRREYATQPYDAPTWAAKYAPKPRRALTTQRCAECAAEFGARKDQFFCSRLCQNRDRNRRSHAAREAVAA
jgi:hypothetical protein